MHGIKTRRQHNPGTHLNLRGWDVRKRKLRASAQIRSILDLHRMAESADLAKNHAVLPPAWTHKAEALVGDTVYLRHNDSIRSYILSALDEADPSEGKVSVASAIGMALIGRHQGDKVRLTTPDGDLDYTVLKII